MEKKFRLPKAFALKWIEALRSGKYKQGTGELVVLEDSSVYDFEKTKFCCLGVASHICGYSIEKLEHSFFIGNEFTNVPNEIIGVSNKNGLVSILSNLNDKGILLIERETLNSLYNFRNFEEDSKLGNFNFAQIADFIEDNCEFYEEV